MLKDISATEILIVFIVLLVLFGGKKLPEFGRGIGEAIKELKKSLKS